MFYWPHYPHLHHKHSLPGKLTFSTIYILCKVCLATPSGFHRLVFLVSYIQASGCISPPFSTSCILVWTLMGSSGLWLPPTTKVTVSQQIPNKFVSITIKLSSSGATHLQVKGLTLSLLSKCIFVRTNFLYLFSYRNLSRDQHAALPQALANKTACQRLSLGYLPKCQDTTVFRDFLTFWNLWHPLQAEGIDRAIIILLEAIFYLY